MPGWLPVGRDGELEAAEEFLAQAERETAALVIEGAPGIGKTTLWQAVARRAEERGMQVLSTRPGPAETRLTFVGLADMLGDVDGDTLAEVPTPQRQALKIALLQADPAGHAPDQRALGTAALSVLRLLSAGSPVLVAIDDLQWLDSPSWRVVEFALRRLGPERVGFLAALLLEEGPAHAHRRRRARAGSHPARRPHHSPSRSSPYG